MRILTLLLLAIILLSSPCRAGWLEISANQYDSSFQLNSDMFYVPNSGYTMVNIWAKQEIAKNDPLTKETPGLKSWVSFACVDLKGKKLAQLFHIYYDQNGNIIKAVKTDPVSFEDIPPNSVGEIIYNVVFKLHTEQQIPKN